jgi:hypothetical protein
MGGGVPGRNDAADKKVARAFLLGPVRQKHDVFRCTEVDLTAPADFCPPRQECEVYGSSPPSTAVLLLGAASTATRGSAGASPSQKKIVCLEHSE